MLPWGEKGHGHLGSGPLMRSIILPVSFISGGL